MKSGDTVFVHGAASTPNVLLKALVERATELKNVELVHLHTFGPAEYAHPRYGDSFRVTNLFIGENIRSHVDLDRIDYMPCFLSEIPSVFQSRAKKIDVALISLSPPDAHGFCSLGTSVDVARAAVECARVVIAQVNSQLPRTHGASFIHLSNIDGWVACDEPLHITPCSEIGPDEREIGRLVAELVENGSTLQAGVGAIPDACLVALENHRHLGVHSEMWSDHMLRLIEKGVVDNSRKRVHAGKTIASFCYGSEKVYAAVHDNPSFGFYPADFVNSSDVIAQNPKVIAINSAVEIDLSGQVCADSIGPRLISGVGGQMDFMRGALLSRGGKPILAMKSRTGSGRPKIVPQLAMGAGVVTTRAHAHDIVTECGVANIFGRSIGERAKLLTDIAHPDDREALMRDWHTLLKKKS